MAERLTLRKLRAIQEALTARLAGEIDDFCPPTKDYEDALSWCGEQIDKRAAQ